MEDLAEVCTEFGHGHKNRFILVRAQLDATSANGTPRLRGSIPRGQESRTFRKFPPPLPRKRGVPVSTGSLGGVVEMRRP